MPTVKLCENVSVRILLFSLALSCLPVPAAARDNGLSREAVLDHLQNMRRSQRGMMNIAADEGVWLETQIRELDAKRVLEIGTSNGYSAIWMGLGLRETDGKLITLEIDESRYRLAQENIRATGMENVIEVRLADALEEIRKLEGPFDLVFIDAWKPDYVRYLEMLLPLMRSGGIIAAHNVFNTGMRGIPEYRDVIDSHPQLETRYVREGSSGISVSKKK